LVRPGGFGGNRVGQIVREFGRESTFCASTARVERKSVISARFVRRGCLETVQKHPQEIVELNMLKNKVLQVYCSQGLLICVPKDHIS
jgi:hypothetical protein